MPRNFAAGVNLCDERNENSLDDSLNIQERKLCIKEILTQGILTQDLRFI